MTASDGPLLTLLLPGLDGTGRLLDRFVAAASGRLELRTLSYPPDRALSYAELAELVRAELPRGRRFALVGESFGGPLALRVAAGRPPGLVGVVLAASFHRRPAARLVSALRPLSPAFFRLPLPAHAVRVLLAGHDAPDALVADVQAAVASVRPRVMARRAHEALHVDATGWLRDCPAPVLFLGGRQDRLLRTGLAIEIRLVRPDAEIRMLDAPHLVLQRRPAEAMRAVEAFLERSPAATAPMRAASADEPELSARR
ncbi:BioH protein, putative [Anaeromyxobacter sp. K]|uniref:alpha/beta fold hydrolase n=1 Tax=Anaeromyxobacter sp. (strain K) TaxID=447217 RepID=UPI00017BE2F7|nr:alpha/beta hydrolase [Anaeromyxobacter sp. K]ACG71573.1 BioH protein, putative [Anaeromyxobacter sp. K]